MERKRTRFLAFLLCEFLFIVILLEFGSRVFWRIKHSVPFFHTEKIVYVFYPELRPALEKSSEEQEAAFDILLLGGSVLTACGGHIEAFLLKTLTYKTKMNIRIDNVAKEAHSSLDSLWKYVYLKGNHYDLVVFYHGINEVRANNCPSSVFDKNYLHYSYYRYISRLQKNEPIIRFFVLPYTFEYIWIKLSDKLARSEYVPTNSPRESWVMYGSSIKTAESLKDNLRRIIDIATLKEEQLLVMSFAYYLPEDYTRAKFESKSLDYTRYRYPVELWGTPENVIAGLVEHNRIIEQVSQDFENVYFIDQNNLIPKNGKYFSDICHLTRHGSQRFVNNISDYIVSLMN